MLNIEKTGAPPELEAFRNASPTPGKWNHIKWVPGLKKRLKKHILEREQEVNGGFCCVYCERKIYPEHSHIEHVKPRALFPEAVFDYDNLTVSCQVEEVVVSGYRRNLKTCGHRKGEQFDESVFINPVIFDPGRFFTYDETTGEIIPAKDIGGEDQLRARYTIDLLNLNHRYLKDRRAEVIDLLHSQDNREDLFFYLDNLDQFPHLVEFYKKELLPAWNILHNQI